MSTIFIVFVIWVIQTKLQIVKFPVPSYVIVCSIFGLLILNIVVFSFNLILSLFHAKNVKDEGELEKIMVPALKGNPEYLPEIVTVITQCLTAICLGLIGGTLIYVFFKCNKSVMTRA